MKYAFIASLMSFSALAAGPQIDHCGVAVLTMSGNQDNSEGPTELYKCLMDLRKENKELRSRIEKLEQKK